MVYGEERGAIRVNEVPLPAVIARRTLGVLLIEAVTPIRQAFKGKWSGRVPKIGFDGGNAFPNIERVV
jgi:hypothetical protein